MSSNDDKTVSKEKPPADSESYEETQWKRSPNLWDNANIISKLYCLFIFPFMYRNYQKNFDLSALPENSKIDDCVQIGERLKLKWNQESARCKAGKSASLLRALVKTFGKTWLYLNFLSFLVSGIIRSIIPLILGRIINFSNLYFEESTEKLVYNSTLQQAELFVDYSTPWYQFTNRQNVVFFSAILSVMILVNILIPHPFFMAKYRFGMHVRSSITRLIYEKALRVTSTAVQRFTIGQVVNLISNDVNRFDVCFVNVEFSYLAIPETMIGMTILYWYFGRSSLGTLIIIFLYIPFQTVMAKILSQFRGKSIVLTDNRLRLMSEILPAMRVIKMYVWEKPFSKLVHIARKLEILKIRQSMMLRCVNLALFFVSSKVMAFVCIILFLLDGGELNAEIVFVSMSMFSQIRENMTYHFPFGIAVGIETYISIKRIEKFLLEDEITDYRPATPQLPVNSNQPKNNKISLEHVSVKSEIDGITILNDISFEVVPKKLTVIIGPVGSGKSSVLLSILNEMPISSTSQINITGKLIYVSQESWIFTGTVRDNILFGREYNAVKYREVVNYAALQSDFKQFEHGDLTDVDDRGTSLSGGQRARISLARALYSDADCYLLDDPLSAVDASVAKHIFEKCIKEYLRNKCVILVTHQLQFIKQADQIVVLKDGSCLARGSYTALLREGIDFFKYSATEPQSPQVPGPEIISLGDIYRVSRATSFTSFIDSDTDSISNYDQSSLLDFKNQLQGLDLNFNSNNQAQSQEVAAYSSSSTANQKKSTLKTLVTYVQSGAGPILFGTFFISNLFCQIFFTGSDYWLSEWTDFQEKLHIQDNFPNYTFPKNPIISSDENMNKVIYCGIILCLFIFSIVRTVSYFVICMSSSTNLHNGIFSSLIQAPIVFFDKTPIGVIMNRVSRDLGIIDDLLPQTGFEAVEILGNCLGIFVLCTALNYFIAIPFVFLMILLIIATRFYVNTARQVKRLEGVARSPLFNQMASTLNGLATIRSYRTEQMCIDHFSETQNLHSSAYFTFLSCSRLFGVYLEMLCFVYIFCLIVYMNIQLDKYTGSIIGLTISQSLMLTDGFNWGVRQYCEVENYMTSVERIVEFGKLDKEQLDTCQLEPDLDWPPNGDIEFDNVSLSYNTSNDPSNDDINPPNYVLKNLSFSIQGGEKIGIVGRTGAGKSSLITTLFRLTQPTGCIQIDGIDTGTISLSRLRKGLSIIPQEPILFSGNIRRNLDPFNEKSDEELWDAVEKVQLKAKIQSLPAKLDSPVSECGSDFSVGQKQLVCLARAILRKNRILILDEATANVDPRTDNFIQQTIRTEFSHCTVLTIAHRLNTIIDYDRVMVLDSGSLAQFDKPFNLIEQGDGIFFELYDNLSPDVKTELRTLAEKAAKLNEFTKIF